MAFTFLLGTNIGDAYAYALGSPTRGQRLYDPDFTLRQDPDAYAKLYRDATIAGALKYRKHLIAGRDWYLEPASTDPADRKVARVLESIMQRIPRFASARYNLAEAFLRGSSWAKIYWDKETIRLHGDDTKRTWVTVKALQDAAKMRFRLQKDPDAKEDDDLHFRWEVYRPKAGKWEAVDLGEWVHHVYDDAEETLGHGRGVAESLYQYWQFKAAAFVYYEQYLDRWANGLIHCGIDSLRSQSVGTGVGPNGRALSPEDRAQQWANALNSMRHQHVLVHDKADELGVLDAPSNSGGASLEAIKYADAEIRILVIGSNLPSGATGGGSYALAEVQEGTTETYVGYDRLCMEETITDQLVQPLHAMNAAVFREMNLDAAHCPRFRLRKDKYYNPKERIEIAKALVNDLGVTLREDEVVTQSGFTPAVEGEKVISPRASAPIGALPGAPSPGATPPPDRTPPPPGGAPPATETNLGG